MIQQTINTMTVFEVTNSFGDNAINEKFRKKLENKKMVESSFVSAFIKPIWVSRSVHAFKSQSTWVSRSVHSTLQDS